MICSCFMCLRLCEVFTQCKCAPLSAIPFATHLSENAKSFQWHPMPPIPNELTGFYVQEHDVWRPVWFASGLRVSVRLHRRDDWSREMKSLFFFFFLKIKRARRRDVQGAQSVRLRSHGSRITHKNDLWYGPRRTSRCSLNVVKWKVQTEALQWRLSVWAANQCATCTIMEIQKSHNGRLNLW